MKRRYCFLFLGAMLAFAEGAALLAANSGSFLDRVQAEAASRWKHFQGVEATYDKRGIKEYWTDCIGGNPVFEAPSDVEIVEGGTPDSEFINSLDLFDERILPSFYDYDVYASDYSLTYDKVAVTKTKEIDHTYGEVYCYDMGSISLSSTDEAHFSLSNAINGKFDNSARFYIYSEVSFRIVYARSKPEWSETPITIPSKQWFEFNIPEDFTSKGQGQDFVYFFALDNKAESLATLGTVKISRLVGGISKYQNIDENFSVVQDTPWKAFAKTAGEDSTIGTYYKTDLSTFDDATNKRAYILHKALVNNIKGRETFFYFKFDRKDVSASMKVSNPGNAWEGFEVNYVPGEWTKVTLSRDYVSRLTAEKGVYFFIYNKTDGETVADLGNFYISSVYAINH